MKTKLSQIIFEVTSVCNLNCRYCYNTWKIPGIQTPEQFNSYKKAKETLKHIFRTIDCDHIVFTGGEPTMSERFLELILYTRRKGKTVTIISNGNHPNTSIYKQLVDLGVGLFEIPIHSVTAKAHDYLTNIDGSWKKSVETINTLIQSGANIVGVIVITKANFKQIEQTLEFISELKISRVMLNRFNIGGKGIEELNNLVISNDELVDTYKIAAETGKRLKLSLSSNVCTPVCVLNPKDFRGIRFSACSSDIEKRPITIDINGDLRFCNHSPTILGNIFKKQLTDIFKTKEAKLWDNIIPDFCSTCKVYDKCMAGCRAANEQMSLPISQPDPIISHAGYNKDVLI